MEFHSLQAIVTDHKNFLYFENCYIGFLLHERLQPFQLFFKILHHFTAFGCWIHSYSSLFAALNVIRNRWRRYSQGKKEICNSEISLGCIQSLFNIFFYFRIHQDNDDSSLRFSVMPLPPPKDRME